METLELILPASEIPIEQTVTKLNGSITYKISAVIHIYNKGKQQSILAEDGARFLKNSNAEYFVVSADTMLIWVAQKSDFLDWVKNTFSECIDFC